MPLGLSEGKDTEGGSVATEGLSAKDWLEPAFTEIYNQLKLFGLLARGKAGC